MKTLGTSDFESSEFITKFKEISKSIVQFACVEEAARCADSGDSGADSGAGFALNIGDFTGLDMGSKLNVQLSILRQWYEKALVAACVCACVCSG